ncbi:MAG: hypothetical protein ACEPOW_09165 [Bacteroidales bacterium]
MKPLGQENIKHQQEVLKNLKRQRILTPNDDALVVYDLDILDRQINRLKRLYPKNTFHTTAVKANPLSKILTYISNFNIGAEVASEGELHLALKSGIPAKDIIFDSPAKTIEELEFALSKNININIDSLEELERIKDILKNKTSLNNRIGLRINPQIGEGEISNTSLAGAYSKFGIPITEFKEKIIEAFIENQWLTGLHIHIGSQTCTQDMLIQGAQVITKLMTDINNELEKNNIQRKIEFIDLGGGIPASYYPGPEPLVIEDYIKELRNKCPELWNGEVLLITEIGRWLHAPCATALSKVEYVKETKNIKTAIIHLGADMFIRECYRPEDDWHHEIGVIGADLKITKGLDPCPYNIAGPLCFSGDFIDKNIFLPRVKPGDYLIIFDVGAYTFSMWSRYNSRPMPKICGIRDKGRKVIMLKAKEDPKNSNIWWS